MKHFLLLVFCALLAPGLFAQDSKKKEKVVTVDVMKEGDDQRKVKIITVEDGKEKVIEWTDDGEIPEDIKKQLEEADINISILSGEGEGGEMVIEVETDEEDVDDDKRVIKIKKKMKGKGKGKSGKSMIWIGDDDEIRIVEDKQYKIVTIDDEGNESVIEWDGEGEMPEELKEHFGEMDIEIHEEHEGPRRHRMRTFRGDDRRAPRMRGEGNVFFFETDDDEKVPNAYLGAQIESHDEGVHILDVMKDSPADKAKLAKGDVIQKLNGARTRTMDDLLTLLSFYEPGDEVTLSVWRNSKASDMKLTLGERPDHYR